MFQRGNKIFLFHAWDCKKEDYLYRPIGGSVEFGEYAESAIRREISEEMAAEIKNLRLFLVVENIFTCDGIDGHEIDYIFSSDFVDPAMYEEKEYLITESNGVQYEVGWESMVRNALIAAANAGRADLLS
jgi:ADP-ribose pyrophosphatase YjhB (NUDIX family)